MLIEVGSKTLNRFGVKEVVLCEPSQKIPSELKPQVQHI
tara:strand:+ start:776 stop:892 length:117 start_codon:yes stop_codon:yes gene_type:complete